MDQDNWYEIQYGNRVTSEDLAIFVKENAYTPVRTLTEFNSEFMEKELKQHKKVAFFVDFFAPVSFNLYLLRNNGVFITNIYFLLD